MLSVRILKRLGDGAGPTGLPARLPARSPARSEAASNNRPFDLDVDFQVPAGVTILFGASGSGKTTTLRSIAGIVRPDAGRIAVNGKVLFDSEAGINLPIRKREAGYVFQSLALLPHLTALENVAFAISDSSKSEKYRKSLEFLEALKISHTAARRPANISGGEAQRIALARALAAKPKFLLLDEPLSAIDESTKSGIIADLKSINRDLQLPVLYVTHSRDEAVSLGERLLVIEQGRISARGEPLDIFGPPLSPTIARLTGVENLFKGVVNAIHRSAGIVSVDISDPHGECKVEAPLGNYRERDQVTVAIRSGDILLATERPEHTSARNNLQGRITGLERRSDRTLVRVLAGVEWVVSVTEQAVEELKLESGSSVWLAFKTHSCYVLDGERGGL